MQTQKNDDVSALVEEFQKLTEITDMEILENLRKQLQDEKRVGGVSSFAQGLDSKPHFSKYYWQVYVSPPIAWPEIEGEENFERFKRDYKVIHSDGTVDTEYTGTYEEYLAQKARDSSRQGNEKRRVLAMPKMSHAKFLKTMKWLEENRIAYVISNTRSPRRNTKWDDTAERWKGVEFAPSFDDDTDELATDGRK